MLVLGLVAEVLVAALILLFAALLLALLFGSFLDVNLAGTYALALLLLARLLSVGFFFGRVLWLSAERSILPSTFTLGANLASLFRV